MPKVQRPWLGKSRNMETKTRSSAEGASAEMRVEGMSNPGTGKEAASRVSRGDSVALSESLAGLTTRERAIFGAGVAEGSSQTMQQLAEQHTAFVSAAASHAAARRRHAVASLAALPPVVSKGAAAGTELGRRVLAAGKALLGKR